MKENSTDTKEPIVDAMYKKMMAWLIGPEHYDIKMQTLKGLYFKVNLEEYTLSENIQTTAASEGFIEKDGQVNTTITQLILKHVKLDENQLTFS